MKAKAASKSTNWNLRVMASRSLASCQSGNRFSAAFSSSIVNFAITTSHIVIRQGIFLFQPVDAAVAGQLAGVKTERADGEFCAGIKRMVGQPYPHPLKLGMAQPRQSDMGHELVGILRLADPADSGIHLAGEMLQQIVRARRRP